MILMFFALRALGAVLLLTCSALVWSERMSVLRTLPACAKCGYDLAGLARAAKCPVCGGIWRKFTAGVASRIPTNQSVLIWAIPTVAGLIAAGMVTVSARIPAPDNVLGTLACSIPYAATGILIRIMLRWITLAAGKTMMWCAIIALSLALVAVMLEATLTTDFASTTLETYRLAPIMIAPFAGYGLAGGILLLAWVRSRPARMRSPNEFPDRF